MSQSDSWLPAFGNSKWPYAALTGGTQFVNVNQSFTNTFGRAKFCKQLELQTAIDSQAMA